MSKLLAAVAATALVATPALANQAQTLSVAKASNVKAQSASANGSDLAPAGGVIAAVAAVAIGLGIYLAVDEGGDDNDDSDSN